jgi:hypothetical protein
MNLSEGTSRTVTPPGMVAVVVDCRSAVEGVVEPEGEFRARNSCGRQCARLLPNKLGKTILRASARGPNLWL